MSSIKGEKSSSKIVSLLVLVFCIGIAYVAGDFLMPMHRWLHMDWQAVADKYKKYGVTAEQLQQEQEYLIRYHPRRQVKNDPYPWQIIHKDPKKTPAWVYKMEDRDPKKDQDYEWQTLIRVKLISDRTGQPPREPWEINVLSTYQDRYFRVTGWRLPPGAIDETDKGRSTLYIKVSSLEKLSIDEAIKYHHQIPAWLKDQENGWLEDDLWPERYDGHGPLPD